MTSLENKYIYRHNSQVSIAKGIGITLMVVGHSGCPEYLHNVIYCFHMVLFYFLSGYFFRDNKVVESGKNFMFRKFKGLYWPYIKWSIVFILLHNLFFEIGFNESALSQQEMWINVKRSIRGMWQGEHFLGAYWFLMSLFWEIVIFSLIIWVKNKIKMKYFISLTVLVLFLTGLLTIEYCIEIWVNRELMVLPFFYLGYMVGNSKLVLFSEKYEKRIAYLLCLPILLVVATFTQISIGGNNYGLYYIYVFTSFCGIYLIMVLSKQLNKTRLGKMLDYIGGGTLSIMTFHFFAFKLLSALLVVIMSLPNSYLQEWPVPDSLKEFWLLYSIVGILIPIGMLLFYSHMKSRCLSIIKK